MQIIKQDQFDDVIKSGITLVDFYADWCGPCKMLGPVLEEVAKSYPNINFVKINCDDNMELCDKYQILSIPAVFLFKDGELIGKTGGYQSDSAIKSFIDNSLGK